MGSTVRSYRSPEDPHRDAVATAAQVVGSLDALMMTAEQLIDLYLNEGPTRGMKNAYAKRMEARYKCVECGSMIPKYEGRYPGKCPECNGTELEDLQNTPRYSENDRRKMNRQMRMVPQDRIGGE